MNPRVILSSGGARALKVELRYGGDVEAMQAFLDHARR